MKEHLKNWIFTQIRFLAQRRLKRMNAKVVGMTGSVGKSSTKEAIYTVLERRYRVMKTTGNMNTEFGIALSLLDEKPPQSAWWKWPGILWRAFRKSFLKTPQYDQVVLEMGVDKPGDMDAILNVVHPDVMLFLNVKNVHIGEGHFANRKEIFKEKGKACYKVSSGGWAVLNSDDAFVKQLKDELDVNVLTIGLEEDADLRAKSIEMDEKGLHFQLAYEDKSFPVHLPNVLGEQHVLIALAAIAVGFIFELPWKTIHAGLKEFHLPPGRMNPIAGKNGSMIIDSSYNASPDTVRAALKMLEGFGKGRRIAALGTMNELGALTESSHLDVGHEAAKYADKLIAVGEYAHLYAKGAEEAGMARSQIHVFPNSKLAGDFFAGEIQRNDIVLVKGSQNNVRMEHFVKRCMQEPEQARHLLVRQEPYWLTKS